MRRPSIAEGDTAYYRYVVIVAALMFLVALLHVRGKPGRAWAAIRESEPAALAAGVNIVLYKLWAFALASFMAGVAGGLLAAQVGQPTAQSFPTQDSLTLLATTLMGGIYSLWGAVVAGVLQPAAAVPLPGALGRSTRTSLHDPLRRRRAPGAADGARRAREQFPKDMANLGRLVWRGVRQAHRRGGAST